MKSSSLKTQTQTMRTELERYKKGDLSSTKDLLVYMKESSEYIKKKLEVK